MDNVKNWAIGLIAVVALVLGFAAYNKTVPYGATPGPDHYKLQQFFGGVMNGNVLATSTGSATMVKGFLKGYDTVIVNATGAASAKTLTFFASSTATDWLPKAGNTQTTCFMNATTTAGVTLVFAAGTGIDLQVATSTGSTGGAFDLTIQPDSTACFKFIRKAATATAFDIEANMVEYEDAD